MLEQGNAVVRRKKAANEMPARCAHVVGLLKGKTIVVFGGCGQNGILSDTFQCSLSHIGCWKLVCSGPTENHPSPKGRQHSSFVSYMEELYLFGGDCGDELCNDLWCYTTTTGWHCVSALSSGSPPPAMWGHSAVAHKEYMYVFGGNLSSGPSSDLFRFSFSLKIWEKVLYTDPLPPQMFYASTLLENKWFLLFGSRTSSVAPKMLCCDLDTFTWTLLASPPVVGLMRGYTLINFEGILFLHGGKLKSGIADDAYLYQPCSDMWQKVTPSPEMTPPALYFHSVITSQDHLYILGGISSTGHSSDITRVFIPQLVGTALGKPDLLSTLHDEILMRIFSYLRQLGTLPSLWFNHVEVVVQSSTLYLYESYPKLDTSSVADKGRNWCKFYYNARRVDSFYHVGHFVHKKQGMHKLIEKIGARQCLKLAVVGSPAVGKSGVTRQLICGHLIEEDPEIIDSFRKQWRQGGKSFLLEVMDAAEPVHEDFRELFDQFMTTAYGYIIVYSVTDVESFVAVDKWLKLIATNWQITGPYGFGWPAIVLCANKCDLIESRKIPTATGMMKALEIGCPYIETSAVTRKNLEETFFTVIFEAARLLRILDEQGATKPTKCLLM
ncbi:GTP-binding protein Rit2 [Pelomyxa schiedti]|nr:GTP-binding protein Rit2 [Pelomyxa schiedti]